MKQILFVCTGNTCRSAMAEGIFNYIVQSRNSLINNYIASSAGINAIENDLPSHLAVKALSELWGIDISRHRARRINSELLKDSFLIITMTKAHKEIILKSYPETIDKNKIFTLKEFVVYYSYENDKGNQKVQSYEKIHNFDIEDPYSMPIEVYLDTAKEIYDLICKFIDMLGKSENND